MYFSLLLAIAFLIGCQLIRHRNTETPERKVDFQLKHVDDHKPAIIRASKKNTNCRPIANAIRRINVR